jgi:predicted kinase
VTCEVLVIGGAAGVGKSATAYEISHQLRAAGVAHAVVDTDALDHVFPVPDDLSALTERNLAAVWEGLSEHGVTRLVLTGVYLHRPTELAWISRAVPDARFTLVRLAASETTLRQRIAMREIGSARQAQVERTMRQLAELEGESNADVRTVETDGASVRATAANVLEHVGWAAS